MNDHLTLFDNDLSPLTRHRPVMPASDPDVLARASDPDTSKAAARSVAYRSGSQKLRLLMAYVDAERPLMDGEAAQMAGLFANPRCGWWKRCSELRNDEMLKPVGIARSPWTGEEVMVCVATGHGKAVVAAARARKEEVC